MLSACPDGFDDYRKDPIDGSWTLLSVEGFDGCTVSDGELTVYDIEGESLSGDFYWSATCDAGMDIAEAGDIAAIEVDLRGSDYGMDILIHTPANRAIDWDCAMADNELTCSGGDPTPTVFEFVRN